MGEREHETTHKEGRGRESNKGLPSSGDVYSEEKISSEDTRGAGSLMANPALEERVIDKKQSPETKPQDSSVQNTEQAKLKESKFNRDTPTVTTIDVPPNLPEGFEPKQSPFVTAVFRSVVFHAENQLLRMENEQLRDENEELTKQEEQRKEKQRKRAAKWRESHPETHKERERERHRKRRVENQ
jgi:hypothetical protein